jgi:hypothetical protein
MNSGLRTPCSHSPGNPIRSMQGINELFTMFSRATASGVCGNSCDDLPDRFSSRLLSQDEPTLEKGEFYQLTADDEKCGSEVVLMSEQDEAEWLDRFEYEPRHDQKEQCGVPVQRSDPSKQSRDPLQRHQTPSQRTHNRKKDEVDQEIQYGDRQKYRSDAVSQNLWNSAGHE